VLFYQTTVKILISASFMFLFIVFAALFSTSVAFYPVSTLNPFQELNSGFITSCRLYVRVVFYIYHT